MSDDESLERVQAADPARGRATDLESLRRAVDARLREQPRSQSAPPPKPERDGLAARRARRSRRSAWLGGIAASVIVGVSGYLVGLGSGGGADSAGGAAEDAGADSEVFTASDGQGGSAGGDSEEVAEPTPLATQESMTDDAMEPDHVDDQDAPTRVEFVDSGLSEESGTAEAFGYDPAGIATASRAQQVAEALGIVGTAVQEGTAWVVTDAEGRRVALQTDGVATLTYRDATLDPGACAITGNDVSSPDSLGTCADTGALSDPIATVRDTLAAVGADVGRLDLVLDDADPGIAVVNAYPSGSSVVGDPAWSATVAAEGVSDLTGRLAPLTSLGDYDVISPAAAVERLSDPRFGAVRTGQQLEDLTGGDWTPAPGGVLPWSVTTHTLTGAELTLMAYPLTGTATALLPTWALTADDGATWLVVAVTDEALGL